MPYTILQTYVLTSHCIFFHSYIWENTDSSKVRFVEKKIRLYEGDLGLGEAIILKNKKGDFFGWARVRGGGILDESGPSRITTPAHA